MYLHEHMSLAMSMAKIAYANDEVPVGAIIVKDGMIISDGFVMIFDFQSEVK